MSQGVMKACLNVLRRTPPGDVENNLERLVALRPELDEELYQRVDTPLETQEDPKAGKPYVLCDYNRDGDSFRSPWSNNYYPPIDDGDEGFQPSPELRRLEEEANQVFDQYRHFYYEGGVSSVYMWDLDAPEAFAACFCVQKDAKGDKNLAAFKGNWSSVHVFEVVPKQKDTFNYRLTSTVLVSMPISLPDIGDIDLSGSITKQAEKTATLKTIGDSKESHLEYMGPMLEDLELDLRNTIQGVYFEKTKEIVNGMRVTDPELKSKADKMASLGKQAVGN